MAETAEMSAKREIWQPPADARGRKPTNAEVWDMIAGCEWLLRREVRRRVPRSRQSEFDEFYSDCVTARALSIMATFDPKHPSRACWLTHLIANVKWYAYKRAHGRNGHWREIRRDVSGLDVGLECQNGSTFTPAVLSRQEETTYAALLLAMLSPEDAALVRWRAMDGYDYDEIAGALRCSRASARERVARAVARLRELAWQDGPAGRFLEEFGGISEVSGMP